MAYRVDRFNGSFLVNVEDGTVDNTTDLRLLGKHYPGYGEVLNENFLHLLENFANSSAPARPISGQIWFDTNTRQLFFFDGTLFKAASGSNVSRTPPSNLSIGEFWFDQSADQVKVWNGSKFLTVGPDTASSLIAASLTPFVVKDTANISHTILRFDIKDQTVGVVSSSEFSLNPAVSAIEGFDRIKRGITLRDTSSDTGISNTDFYFWGTASNAKLFNGRPETDFVLRSNASSFADSGITVGDQNDLKIHIENGNSPVIENQLGNISDAASLTLRINGSSKKHDVVIVTQTGAAPSTNNEYDLGTAAAKWKTIYGTKVVANVEGNLTGNTDGRHTGDLYDKDGTKRFDATTGKFFGDFEGGVISGTFTGTFNGTSTDTKTISGFSVSAESKADTIPVRDAQQQIFASKFIGIASQADQLLVNDSAAATTGQYKVAKTIAAPNTIAARNADGDLFAVTFNGTATAARYADLAEKYLTDQEYPVGTVVSVGGLAEVTASTKGKRPLGVVSQNPAFMMNSEQEGGTYIALKGRVPVRVIGPVKKGDCLVPSETPGVAIAGAPNDPFVFADALSNLNSNSHGTVEAVVQ